MKSPLVRRLPKELKRDFKKYLIIFLILFLTIGFVSGMFVANNSMLEAGQNAFAKYNVEDGHFNLSGIPTQEMITEIDKVCIMKGRLPEADGEIAIDRMHADNANMKVGDNIYLDGVKYKITGLIAAGDYSALYKNNSDTMFDALTFDIGFVTGEQYEKIEAKEVYQYAWIYNKKLEDDEARDFLLSFMASFEPSLVDSLNMEHAGTFHSKTSKKLANLLGYGKKTKDLSITNLTRLDISNIYGNYEVDFFSFIPPVISNAKNVVGLSTLGDSTVMTIHRVK